MSVLAEALSVIVPVEIIERHWPGGVRAYERDVPNNTWCCDGVLTRVGFMAPSDVSAWLAALVEAGLCVRDDERWLDACVVDQEKGPTLPCDWLEFTRDDGGWSFAWRRGMPPGELAVPGGWTPERALGMRQLERPESRLRCIAHERGVLTCVDVQTGELLYLGTVSQAGDFAVARLDVLQGRILELQDANEGDPGWAELLRIGEEVDLLARIPGVPPAVAAFALGLAHRVLGRWAEARGEFERFTHLEPEFVGAWQELTMCCAALGDREGALSAARRAVELDDTSAGAWSDLAMSCAELGRMDEARSALARALELDPDDPITREVERVLAERARQDTTDAQR